jgi:hypothetical protein
MSGLLLFALGFLCGAGLMLALCRGGDARDLTGPPRIAPRPAIRPPGQTHADASRTPVRIDSETIEDAEILDLIRRGRKIEAIKRMRDLTGMGLAEAKDAVETLERTLR